MNYCLFRTNKMDKKHMQAAIKKGLLASPKYIPTWYVYDVVGSDAYKQGSKITPDYYLFKSDMAIISTYIEVNTLYFRKMSHHSFCKLIRMVTNLIPCQQIFLKFIRDKNTFKL